jgi:hypothetical protein
LAKIEGELSAIKRELTDLRQELSVLRTRNAELEATAAPQESPEAEEDGSGFFEEEDEDETIALTGAELDNILNTAEFTEEDGEPTEIDDAEIELETDLEPATDEATIREPGAGEPAAGQDVEAEAGGDELIDLEIEEPDEEPDEAPDEEISIDEPVEEELEIELEEPDHSQAFDQGVEDLEDLSQELPEAEEPPESTGTVEDFEATLGYSEQMAAPPSETAPAEAEREGDSLADRETEPEEEEIDLGIAEEDDIIPLEPEPESETADLSFEDTTDETPASAPIEEIELEELDEEDDDGPVSSIPTLDELEEEDESVSEGEGVLPDLDIDAELADIGELSDEPEELPQSDEVETIPSIDREEVPTEERPPAAVPHGATGGGLSDDLKGEIRSVLSYMDQLLESLPEEKIEEFARSEHFEVYRKLFEELGLER